MIKSVEDRFDYLKNIHKHIICNAFGGYDFLVNSLTITNI